MGVGVGVGVVSSLLLASFKVTGFEARRPGTLGQCVQSVSLGATREIVGVESSAMFNTPVPAGGIRRMDRGDGSEDPSKVQCRGDVLLRLHLLGNHEKYINNNKYDDCSIDIPSVDWTGISVPVAIGAEI